MEIRPIPGFPGYFVSDRGVLFSDLRGSRRELKLAPYGSSSYGYFYVNLTRTTDGVRRKHLRPVHRLVLLAFRGPPKKGQVSRHLNGIPTDNRIKNLVWGSWKENQQDRVRHGTSNHGERNALAKLTEESVREIRHRRDRGETYASIAADYGCDFTNIYHVCKRNTWKQVT